ncbi:MAG: hypothetical protein ACRDH6_08585 [Actinomycetota bacterium]
MTDQPDTIKGWCCEGITYAEHAAQSGNGDCCQPEGMQLEDLPPEGQEKARRRLQEASQ